MQGFISMRQEMLLQAIPDSAGQRIVARFITGGFCGLNYGVLKRAGGSQSLRAVNRLMERGWLKRSGDGRYHLTHKVVNHLRDKEVA